MLFCCSARSANNTHEVEAQKVPLSDVDPMMAPSRRPPPDSIRLEGVILVRACVRDVKCLCVRVRGV
jgi:hypothetical protein